MSLSPYRVIRVVQFVAGPCFFFPADIDNIMKCHILISSSMNCLLRFEIIDLEPDIPADQGEKGMDEGPCSISFQARALHEGGT